MGLTFRHLHKPTFWKTCPACKVNLVDEEISSEIKPFCEIGSFHSRLLGGRNLETNEIEYWKCPDCKTVFLPENKPVVHTMSNAYLK